MKRRQALQAMAALSVSGASAGTAAARDAAGAPASPSSSDVPIRAFGRANEKVSAVGLGGYHVGVPKDPADGIKIVRSAIDRGITFMDNCWDYHDGESERRMGQACATATASASS
jgi:hypothetical protein